ncbi:MAG: hypothetical protein AAF664_24085 [Planctomycetota bacterium]
MSPSIKHHEVRWRGMLHDESELIAEDLSESDALRRRPLLIALIAFCSVGFLAADVATPVFFEDAFPAMLSLGVVTAQLTVISVWGTLVHGAFWVRLPWTLLMLTISWCALGFGNTIDHGHFYPSSMLALGIVWTLGFITSFVPLKIAAVAFGWKIIANSDSLVDGKRKSQTAVRDILTGTLLLALTMAIVRGPFVGERVDFQQAWDTSRMARVQNAVALLIFGVVSLIVKLPCIWIGLGVSRSQILRMTLVWVFLCFLLSVLEVVVFVSAFGAPGTDELEAYTAIILSHQIMGGIVLGICLALRGLGYRLERSRTPPVE